MSVNVKPLADRVLIEAAPAEEKTAFGIIIPDTAKEKPQKGTVVAVGPGKKDEPLSVKVGDAVLYGKYSGQELSHEGEDYLIMREDDILAINVRTEVMFAAVARRAAGECTAFAVLPTGAALVRGAAGWETVGAVEVHGDLPTA